ncbi:MAG TPA: hypothetical protein VGI28_01840 [Stellaceae bacterium]|jgi:predicted RNase H-like nuclease (RuvC/YqgF family)
MADEILDFLKERFNRIDSQLAELRRDVREQGQRITRLEQQMAQMSASEQGHYAVIMERLDHLGERIDRIERRLDLVDH